MILNHDLLREHLGNLQISDFRNFGHGRHNWLAQYGKETGIISLISNNSKQLAEETLSLIPDSVKKSQIIFHGSESSQRISALISGFYISLAAGNVASIDPGKPEVQEFGRKLFKIKPKSRFCSLQDNNQKIAVQRKLDVVGLGESEEIWREHYNRSKELVTSTPIGALILDYDDTLYCTADRCRDISQEILKSITSLIKDGTLIGIATGRGRSVGRVVRNAISRKYWDHIIMGYYNGNEIAPLSEVGNTTSTENEHVELVQNLKSVGMFKNLSIVSQRHQISIKIERRRAEYQAIQTTREILNEMDIKATVTVSSRSIDITFNFHPKVQVLEYMQKRCINGEIFRIGDKGAWNGNDYFLLDSPFGFSVDQVSNHTQNCWNFAPPGFKGVQATKYYLSCIQNSGTNNHFNFSQIS